MTLRSVVRLGAILGLALTALAGDAQAQDVAYNQSQLDSPAKLASQEMTARLLARSYPPALKRSGVTGQVQMQFVVDATGRVEPSSVKIVDASSQQFADAAKSVVEEIKFKPGQLKGQAVRSVVSLPIVYQ